MENQFKEFQLIKQLIKLQNNDDQLLLDGKSIGLQERSPGLIPKVCTKLVDASTEPEAENESKLEDKPKLTLSLNFEHGEEQDGQIHLGKTEGRILESPFKIRKVSNNEVHSPVSTQSLTSGNAVQTTIKVDRGKV